MKESIAPTQNHHWLTPQWPAPARVHAVCTTRLGGVSGAPFDSLNLGDHVGDCAEHVNANRARLHQSMQARAVFLAQTHGTRAVWLSEATGPPLRADACITDQAGLACTILVADCLPVLLTNRQGSRVAAAHAGWRGLAGQEDRGVLEVLLEGFLTARDGATGPNASSVLAWLGPCIGPRVYEVGAEVRDAFTARQPAAQALFAPLRPGKWLADLPGLARLRLRALGVAQIYGNDGSPEWCTFSQPAQFFSHRRDGVSGRMAACIWLG